MTSPPTEKPLARAEAHLQAGRFAEAAGAYRAVLLIDPAEAQAHLGLAECALAREGADEAITGLTQAAAELGATGHPDTALHLYAGALTVDPERLELHLDVAELEVACGQDAIAAARLRALAQAYRQAGRVEEATAVEEFVGDDPTEPLQLDDLIVELPGATLELDRSSSASRRRLGRAAVRWQPAGSPGRSAPPPPPKRAALHMRPPVRPLPMPAPTDLPFAAKRRAKTSSPPPAPRATPSRTPSRPPVLMASTSAGHAPATPASKPKTPPAPSPLAQRLRQRSESARPASPVASGPTTAQDRMQRLAASLAAVTAKHKARLRAAPPGSEDAALLDAFEEERTRLFRRPRPGAHD